MERNINQLIVFRNVPPQVLDYFDNTWCLTEVLFSALQGAHGCSLAAG